MENALANPEIYNNPKKAFSLNDEFKTISEELSEVMSKWENLSEELINIESQFE